MSLLYLIKFTVEYKGIPQKQFIKTWAIEADVALKAKEKGKILQIWKVSEENISLYCLVSLFQRPNLGYWVNNTKGIWKTVSIGPTTSHCFVVKWRTTPKIAWIDQK